MPFNLIVVFAPKKVDIDDDGEVVEASKLTPKPASPTCEVATKAETATEGDTVATAKPSADGEDELKPDVDTGDMKDEEVKRVSVGSRSQSDAMPSCGEALAATKPVHVRRNSDMSACDPTKTIRRNSRIPSFTDSDFDIVKSSATASDADAMQHLEAQSAVNIIEKRSSGNVVMTEVNVENFLREALKTLRRQEFIATEPVYMDDQSGKNIQVSVVCERSAVDVIIAHLGHIGVGSLVGSVNVVALESSKFLRKTAEELLKDEAKRTAKEKARGEGEGDGEQGNGSARQLNVGGEEESEKKDDEDGEGQAEDDEEVRDGREKDRKLFLEAASQIRVEQIVEQIELSASFTFDYLSLLLIASIIAGIGLATNNTVAIVASMLVSPIMGPVMALTFGSVINNWSLALLGLTSELISLLMCVVVGFIIGMVAIGIGTDGLWPTDEMKDRGLVDGLALGFAIAIPSGVGVALSILGNNTSSLVGVAISASLLPPAVNCGLAFAYAAMGFQFDVDARLDEDDAVYSTPSSFVHMGGISLALTIVNIGAIYVSGLVMFKLKEVAPIRNKTAFWQRDIQVSRRINTAIHKHRDYKLGIGRAQSIALLQDEFKQVGLDRDMRHELLRLRRGQSMHELLSTSTIRSPQAPQEAARPRLTDIFGVLENDDAGSDDGDSNDHSDAGIALPARTPSPRKKPHPRSGHSRSPATNPMTPHDRGGVDDADLIENIQDIKKRFRLQGRSKSFTDLTTA